MAQEHIDFTTPGGDTVTQALHKAEDNFNDLYAQMAAVVPYAGERNLLINGDGRVNQRGFAGGALGANTYGYDVWRTLGSGASITFGSSVITLNGTICQPVESPDLANATVTLSVRNPSGPITVSLQPDGTTAGVSGVIPAGTGIQKVTLVVPSTLTGNVFVLLSTTSAVTIDGASKRGGIQLELGSYASPYERRRIGQELLAAQRYYQFSISLESSLYFLGQVTSGTLYAAQKNFVVPMRTAPAVTLSLLASAFMTAGSQALLSAPDSFGLRAGMTCSGTNAQGVFALGYKADAGL